MPSSGPRSRPGFTAFSARSAAGRLAHKAVELDVAGREERDAHALVEGAAERLAELEIFKQAKRIKVNPDAPQRWVRRLALERGVTVYMPTPRLRGGFWELDPVSGRSTGRREMMFNVRKPNGHKH